MTSNEIETLTKVIHCLTSPYRVAIVKTLGEHGELSVKEISSSNVMNNLSPSGVSQHIKTLLNAGLVTCRHEHPRVYYSVEENQLSKAKSLFAKL